MATDPHHQALCAALAAAGGNQSRFAEAIGASQQNVSYWMTRRRALPPKFVLAAEAAGFGSRHFLRPDIYPVDAPAVCGTCDHRLDDTAIRACAERDCPHAQKEAA